MVRGWAIASTISTTTRAHTAMPLATTAPIPLAAATGWFAAVDLKTLQRESFLRTESTAPRRTAEAPSESVARGPHDHEATWSTMQAPFRGCLTGVKSKRSRRSAAKAEPIAPPPDCASTRSATICRPAGLAPGRCPPADALPSGPIETPRFPMVVPTQLVGQQLEPCSSFGTNSLASTLMEHSLRTERRCPCRKSPLWRRSGRRRASTS